MHRGRVAPIFSDGRIAWLDRVNSLTEKLNRLKQDNWLLGSRTAPVANSFRSRDDSLRAFLESFLPEYAKREVERHESFFKKARLDEEQTMATVMNDSYNLVVAAAGSGKMRALTARIAFLIERGVSPDNILALAYTNDAANEMEHRLSNQYGIETAKVKTLHSFSRDLAKRSPDFRTGVAVQSEQSKFIRMAA